MDPAFLSRSCGQTRQVVAHLNRENEYTAAVLEGPTTELRDELFKGE